MKKAFIIFVNDMPVYVVLDNEEMANVKLEELRNDAYEKNRLHLRSTFDEYKHEFYWHIHTVEYTN